MINLRVDFHGWKSILFHTKGEVLNACVGGFGVQAMSLGVRDMGS